MTTNFEKVQEFHKVFEVEQTDTPGFPSQETRELRKRLLTEEVKEYLEGEEKNDFENVAKELSDILYIVYGTAASYGIPIDDVFAEVHASNMSKLGEDGKPMYREDGKVLKGPNYFKADVGKVLNNVK